MPKKIVADTCFWFALLEPSDAHHDAARILEEELGIHQLVIPWPTLYETGRLRSTRCRDALRVSPIRVSKGTQLFGTGVIATSTSDCEAPLNCRMKFLLPESSNCTILCTFSQPR